MSQFFAQLASDMTGGPSADALDDVLTVLAALVHTSAALTMDELATALDWSPDRVTSALRIARQHPDITDPISLRRDQDGTYTITARPDRLTATQREALDRPCTAEHVHTARPA
jgi:hypothetical protein